MHPATDSKPLKKNTKAITLEVRSQVERPRRPGDEVLGRKISPCAYQTADDIAEYYKAAEVGAVAVVRNTQYHMLEYMVTEIEGTNPRLGRVYVRGSGAFYAKSGRNCFHPKGQTSLVVPTDEVLEWAKAHPRGDFDWWTFPPERVGL